MSAAEDASESTELTADSDVNVIEPGTELGAVGTDGGADVEEPPEADR